MKLQAWLSLRFLWPLLLAWRLREQVINKHGEGSWVVRGHQENVSWCWETGRVSGGGNVGVAVF